MSDFSLRDPLRGQGAARGLEHPLSYWTSVSGTPPLDDGPLRGDQMAELAIIGAGYTGLSAAYFLAKQHGIRPVVLEANRPGWGCSGRNGGFARPVIGRFSPTTMIKKWGLETARGIFTEGQNALNTVCEIIREGDIACDATETGHLKIAHRSSRMAGLVAEARELRNNFDCQAEILSADEVRRNHIDGPQSHGGLRRSDALGLNPMKLAFGLSEMARKSGATVHSSAPVMRWTKEGKSHVLHTPEGQIRARQVIIATNGYTPEGLNAATNDRLLPVLSHIIVTRPLTPVEKSSAGFRSPHVLTDTRSLLYYYRMLPDDRILFGGRGQIVDTIEGRLTQRASLLRELKRKCNGLDDITVDYDWAGWVCITWDQMPHIHHADDDQSVLYGLGYQGSGVAFGLHAGKLLADRTVGKALPTLPPAFSALPRIPLAAFRRLGQRAIFIAYRIKDEQDLLV